MRKKTKLYKQVDAILTSNDASKMSRVTPRDSDAELYIQILQRLEGAGLNEWQMDLIRTVKFDSMARIRRKMQERGEHMPSPEVAKKRKLRSMIVEQTAPKEDGVGIAIRLEEQLV